MSIQILQAKGPKVKAAPSSPRQHWGAERDGAAPCAVWRLPRPTPLAERPFVPTKHSAPCKSPNASAGPQREAVPWIVASAPGRALAAQARLWRGGRSGLCRGQMFLFASGGGGLRVQMGGSGEGARGAVSGRNADGVSRTQCRWQTILMKRSAWEPFRRFPPPPTPAPAAPPVMVSAGTRARHPPCVRPVRAVLATTRSPDAWTSWTSPSFPSLPPGLPSRPSVPPELSHLFCLAPPSAPMDSSLPAALVQDPHPPTPP